jgi:hypothetical protein
MDDVDDSEGDPCAVGDFSSASVETVRVVMETLIPRPLET